MVQRGLFRSLEEHVVESLYWREILDDHFGVETHAQMGEQNYLSSHVISCHIGRVLVIFQSPKEFNIQIVC